MVDNVACEDDGTIDAQEDVNVAVAIEGDDNPHNRRKTCEGKIEATISVEEAMQLIENLNNASALEELTVMRQAMEEHGSSKLMLEYLVRTFAAPACLDIATCFVGLLLPLVCW